MKHRWRRHLVVLAFFGVATVVMTYPIAFRLADHVPMIGDPQFSAWTLAWGAHHLATLNFQDLFGGNIFYPEPWAMTFSDHLLGWQPVVLPIYALTGNIILAQNLTLMLAVALAGYFMYLLVRRLTGSEAASIFAGLAFTFMPFRFPHLAHLSLSGFFWMPLALLCLHRLIGSGGWRLGSEIRNPPSLRPQTANPKPQVRWGLLGGAAAAMQFNCGLYQGVFLGLLAVLFVLFLVPISGAWRRGRFWGSVAAGALVFAAGSVWWVLPYVRAHAVLGLTRSAIEVQRYSCVLSDYVKAPPTCRLLYALGWPSGEYDRWTAWQGLTVVAMALAGLLAAARTWPAGVPRPGTRREMTSLLLAGGATAALLAGAILLLGEGEILSRGPAAQLAPAHRPLALAGLALVGAVTVLLAGLTRLRALGHYVFRPAFFYATAAVIFLLLSLGPVVSVTPERPLGMGPYRWLWANVPWLSGMRSVERLSQMVSLCLTVLAGLGVAAVLGRLRGPRRRAIFGVGVSVLVIAESWAAPLPMPRVPLGDDAYALARWLAQQPADVVICHVPFPRTDQDEEWQAVYDHLSIFHWRRMLNGYSGFQPRLYPIIRERMVAFPGSEAMEVLRLAGVRYVVSGLNRLPGVPGRDETAEAVFRSIGSGATKGGLFDAASQLTVARRFGQVTVFELRPSSVRPAVSPGTRPEEIELRFLLALLAGPRREEEIGRLEDEILAVCRRLPDKTRSARLVGDVWNGSGSAGRCALLRVLKDLGRAAAVRQVVRALDDPSPEVRQWAVGALSEWRDPDGAADLLAALSRLSDRDERGALLAAYAGLARARAKDAPGAAVEMLTAGVAALTEPAERSHLVSALGGVRDLSALRAAVRFLDEAPLREAAAIAALKIAPFAPRNGREEAAAAVQQALAAAPTPRVRAEAQRLFAAHPWLRPGA
jgi:hypothetical protein